MLQMFGDHEEGVVLKLLDWEQLPLGAISPEFCGVQLLFECHVVGE
jgi:hypothetical protein